MAGLSNCIYRAHSSSKFIMKSLLRFLPVEPWGEKCNPCLCYEGCSGGSHSHAPIGYLQNFTTSQCLLENLSKSYLHCLSRAGEELVNSTKYTVFPWPLIHRTLRKSAKLEGNVRLSGRSVIIILSARKSLLYLSPSARNFYKKFRIGFPSTRDFSQIKF